MWWTGVMLEIQKQACPSHPSQESKVHEDDVDLWRAYVTAKELFVVSEPHLSLRKVITLIHKHPSRSKDSEKVGQRGLLKKIYIYFLPGINSISRQSVSNYTASARPHSEWGHLNSYLCLIEWRLKRGFDWVIAIQVEGGDGGASPIFFGKKFFGGWIKNKGVQGRLVNSSVKWRRRSGGQLRDESAYRLWLPLMCVSGIAFQVSASMSVLEEVFRSFTLVKVVIPPCKSTLSIIN